MADLNADELNRQIAERLGVKTHAGNWANDAGAALELCLGLARRYRVTAEITLFPDGSHGATLIERDIRDEAPGSATLAEMLASFALNVLRLTEAEDDDGASEGKEEAMDDYYGTESYGPPSCQGEDELGTPMFYRHHMTARGLMSSERAREMSRSTDAIVVWSRGEAGSEIFWNGVRYVPESVPKGAQIGVGGASGEPKARLAEAPLPNDVMAHPKAWCLIARDDVQCALNLLALVRAGSVEAIAGICDTAIYVLETGVHEARAVPADFQIESITIHTADGVLVESIRSDGTITFTRPPSSGGIQVSEDIPEDEGDDDD